MSVISMILASLALAGPERAQPSEVCDPEPKPEDFVGAYTVEIGTALMTGSDRTIALNATNTFPAIMALVDGELVLGAGPTAIAFRFADEDEPDWHFDVLGDLKMSSADFEIVVGCPISELPRLIGEGTSSSTEGTPIDFTYRMIAYARTPQKGFTGLVGSLKWSGGGIAATRVVRVSRD